MDGLLVWVLVEEFVSAARWRQGDVVANSYYQGGLLLTVPKRPVYRSGASGWQYVLLKEGGG
jgi:hypothetical protein